MIRIATWGPWRYSPATECFVIRLDGGFLYDVPFRDVATGEALEHTMDRLGEKRWATRSVLASLAHAANDMAAMRDAGQEVS